jgi:signal transduction histidine kinase
MTQSTTPTPHGDNPDDATAQARALLAALREKAAGDAPALVDELAQLDVLFDQATEAAAQATREADAKFTSIMAHELRIPMTSIRGYIDMMAKGLTGELNDMQQQFAEVIQNNVIRMERLVNDVNDLSKIRANRVNLSIRMDMYKNMAMAVEKETQSLAEEKGHTLTFEAESGLPFLNIDPDRFKQAFTNLVRNALLYTPEGQGQVTVAAAMQDGRIRVTVADNGIGMSDKELAHLGEPFWRGDDDLVREYKGHGLGFVIAKRLVEMMGGSIAVESEAGAGTTVAFTLPGMS